MNTTTAGKYGSLYFDTTGINFDGIIEILASAQGIEAESPEPLRSKGEDLERIARFCGRCADAKCAQIQKITVSAPILKKHFLKIDFRTPLETL